MRLFIGASLLIALMLVQSVVWARRTEKSPEQLEECIKVADKNAESVFIVPQLEEIFKHKQTESINPDLVTLLFMECDEIGQDVHAVLTKTRCGKDLERDIVEGKVKAPPVIAHKMAIRDYCYDSKNSMGFF